MPEVQKNLNDVFFSIKQNTEGQADLELCKINFIGRAVRQILKFIGIDNFYGDTYTSTIRNYFQKVTEQSKELALATLKENIKTIGGDKKFDEMLIKTFKGKEKDAGLINKINQLRSILPTDTSNTKISSVTSSLESSKEEVSGVSANADNFIKDLATASNLSDLYQGGKLTTEIVALAPKDSVEKFYSKLSTEEKKDFVRDLINPHNGPYLETKDILQQLPQAEINEWIHFLKNSSFIRSLPRETLDFLSEDCISDLHQNGKLTTEIVALAPKASVEEFYSKLSTEEKKDFVHDLINPHNGPYLETKNILQQLPQAEINEWIHFLENSSLIRSLPRETLDFLSEGNTKKFKDDILRSPNFDPHKYIGLFDWKDIFANYYDKPSNLDQAAIQYDKEHPGKIAQFLKDCTEEEFQVFCSLFAYTTRVINANQENGRINIDYYAPNPTSFGKIKFDSTWSEEKKELYANYKKESGDKKVPLEWKEQLNRLMTSIEKEELINFVKYNNYETNAFFKECSYEQFRTLYSILEEENLPKPPYQKSWDRDKKQHYVDLLNESRRVRNLEKSSSNENQKVRKLKTYSSIEDFESQL